MKKFVEKLISMLEEVAIDALGINKSQFAMDKGEYSSYCSLSLYEVEEKAKELAEEYNNGWIPCSERLPEKNEIVLCWAESTARAGDTCFVGSCDNGFWFLQSSIGTLSYPAQYNIIAWQPLPEPYQKGE